MPHLSGGDESGPEVHPGSPVRSSRAGDKATTEVPGPSRSQDQGLNGGKAASS